jgi:hypothetical protein
VKSDGDFEDILAADKPDIWESHRPAEGGEAGAMLKKIIERAALLRQGGQADGQSGGQTAKAGARGKAAPKARKAAPRQKATKKATAPRKKRTL